MIEIILNASKLMKPVLSFIATNKYIYIAETFMTWYERFTAYVFQQCYGIPVSSVLYFKEALKHILRLKCQYKFIAN